MRSEPARLGGISFDFAGIPPRRDEYFPHEHTRVDKPGKWADSAHLRMNGPLIWTGCLYSHLTELIDLSIYQSILCIIFMCAHVLLPACGFLRDFIDPSLSDYLFFCHSVYSDTVYRSVCLSSGVFRTLSKTCDENYCESI